MARAKHGHAWSVGIDLHKDTLVACVYCAGCGEISYHKFYCKHPTWLQSISNQRLTMPYIAETARRVNAAA